MNIILTIIAIIAAIYIIALVVMVIMALLPYIILALVLYATYICLGAWPMVGILIIFVIIGARK